MITVVQHKIATNTASAEMSALVSFSSWWKKIWWKLGLHQSVISGDTQALVIAFSCFSLKLAKGCHGVQSKENHAGFLQLAKAKAIRQPGVKVLSGSVPFLMIGSYLPWVFEFFFLLPLIVCINMALGRDQSWFTRWLIWLTLALI